MQLRHLSKAFDAQRAVDDVSFDVASGEFVALLGPSGCGKSTTLRLIAGLEQATSGTISIDGHDVTALPPSRRGLSMVFQNYALFPHLSVAENILFGLEVRKVPKDARKRRLHDAAELLGLTPFLARKPSQLSGGQQQRVALGRAIVAQSPVCLMDEPLSNLDAKLRQEMRREIRALQQRLKLTLIYVTHDQVEAMTMADRIILMKDGRIEQIGTPAELYQSPATLFSASFIGTPPMNLLPAGALNGQMATFGHRPDCMIGVRPEKIHLSDAGLQATVTSVEYLGAETLIEARLTQSARPVIIRMAGQIAVPTASPVHLTWRAEDCHSFDEASGLTLQP